MAVREITRSVTETVLVEVCDLCGGPISHLITMVDCDEDKKIKSLRSVTASICAQCAKERFLDIFYPSGIKTQKVFKS
jgi:hypothetical protein